MRVLIGSLVLLIVTLALIGCSEQAINEPADQSVAAGFDKAKGAPRIIPHNARPNGKTYGKWSEMWWQWMASAPALPGENPILDYTGDLIDYNQSGSVWFLSTSVEPDVVREATIPTGKMLFLCLAAFEASTWEEQGETEEELRASAAAGVDLIEVTSFVIDGVEIPVGPEFRVPSDGMFSLTVPEENVFDWWGFPAPAGTYYPSVADGYYAMITPLSAGDHTIVINWNLLDLVVADCTIHLHVVGG